MSIALTQSNAVSFSGGASTAVSIGASTLGNFIMVSVATRNTTVIPSSVTDNMGSTYTAESGTANTQCNSRSFYTNNCVAGITSITINWSGGLVAGSIITITEFAGVKNTSPILSHLSQAISSGPAMSPADTPAANELMIATVSSNQIIDGVNSPFTFASGALGGRGGTAYYIATSSGSQTATFTNPSPTDNVYAAIETVIAFEPDVIPLNLFDSISSSDTRVYSDNIVKLEAISFADLLTNIVVTIKDLVETMTLSDTLSKDMSISFVDNLLFTDFIQVYISAKLLEDQIQFKDWLNIKKNPAEQVWGD